MGHVSAFIAVASQLILIKSRALLPRGQEQASGEPESEIGDPEAQLRARLLLYRAYRDAGVRLAEDASSRAGLFRREPAAAKASAAGGARPADAPPADPAVLAAALSGLYRVAPPPPPPPEAIPRTITLAERASVIRRALLGAGPVVLQDLLMGVRDRVVVAVTFLAMLELVKRREVAVEQDAPWGPIVVRSTTEAERDGRALDALAAQPIDESLESFA
jgi:segregation and condensation protein A